MAQNPPRCPDNRACWSLGGNKQVKISAVTETDERVWFADSSYWPNKFKESYAAISDAYNPAITSANQPPSKRHRGSSNFLFFDGHAQWTDYWSITASSRAPPDANYMAHWDLNNDGNPLTP